MLRGFLLPAVVAGLAICTGHASAVGRFDGLDLALTKDGAAPALGAINAFRVDRKLPVIVTEDQNAIGCAWQELHAANSGFKLATFSARTWVVRITLRKAVAAVQGLSDPEPSIIDLPFFEDSTDPAKQPRCNRNLPPDAVLSAHLSEPQLARVFGQ